MAATSVGALPTDPDSSTCGGCAINTTVPANYYIPSTPLSAATSYHWQVQGLAAQNGAWSARLSFTTAAAGTPTITAVNPSPVMGSGSAQTLRILGGGFQVGMTATLVNTTAGGSPVVLPTSSVTATKASTTTTFPAVPANWTVMVTNPGGSSSGVYPFRVIQPALAGDDLHASRLTIDAIASPQTVDIAFPVTITAVDSTGAVISVDAEIQLRTSLGAVKPSSVRITNGTATANLKFDSSSCNARLDMTGAGANGTSNSFWSQPAGLGSLTGRVMTDNGTPIEARW
jgi:hypothetical protein